MMRELIKKILREHVNEDFRRSEQPAEERYEIVADKVIEFMDNQKTNSIPDYSTLSNWKPREEDDYKPNMKYLLQKFLVKGEYLDKVVPLIKSKRPNFTSSQRVGRHRVDEFVVVFSNGEKIVYNTFKMNGIELVPQPKDYEFEYEFEGKKYIKKPDFLWPSKKQLIEVAGLEDASYNKNYMRKLQVAKEQSEKNGVKMDILDYFKYRKNLQGFYEYVCKFYGFPYDPMNFWTANMVRDLPLEDLRNEAKLLISKGTSKSFGERDRLAKIVKNLLLKVKGSDTTGEKPEGYSGVWEFKRETGAGMRWSDPKLREQVKKAWCQSSGSNLATYTKFKELFQGVPFSKTMVETMKQKFPEEFDSKKREEICQSSV